MVWGPGAVAQIVNRCPYSDLKPTHVFSVCCVLDALLKRTLLVNPLFVFQNQLNCYHSLVLMVGFPVPIRGRAAVGAPLPEEKADNNLDGLTAVRAHSSIRTC